MSTRRSGDPLVVIPCLDEIGTVEALLERVADENPDALVVLADGGSTDGSRAAARAVERRRCNVVVLDNPQRIQSAGINMAVRRFGAGRRWLVRMDAHADYPSGYVSGLIATAERHDADAVVVPMIATGAACLQQAIAAAQNSWLGNGGSAHRRRGEGCFVEHGHHALMRIDHFAAVGGYCERMTHNEDAELDLRLIRRGARIWLEPSLAIGYRPRRTLRALIRQYHGHGRGRARTLLRHRAQPRLRQMLPVAIAPALLLVVPAVIYALVALGWGGVLALRARSRCAIAAGPAAIAMHMGWSFGFWAELVSARCPRPTRLAPLRLAAAVPAKPVPRPASGPPRVGVVIASYNAARYLADAVQSALDQAGVAVEVLIVDDASRDDSAAIAARLARAHPRVTLIRLARNSGPAAARNAAIAHATGDWLAVLDADDRFQPGRLQTLVMAADHDGADLIVDDLLLVDADGDRPRRWLGSQGRATVPISPKDYLAGSIMHGRAPDLGFLKPVIRMAALREDKVRYDEQLRLGEDHDLVLQLLLAGRRLILHPDAGYRYRKHGGSSSYRPATAALRALVASGEQRMAEIAERLPSCIEAYRQVLRSRQRALDFAVLIARLKARDVPAALAWAARHPRALPLLRMPLAARLARLGAGRQGPPVAKSVPVVEIACDPTPAAAAGVAWLLTDIWPAVRAAIPSARLIIAGPLAHSFGTVRSDGVVLEAARNTGMAGAGPRVAALPLLMAPETARSHTLLPGGPMVATSLASQAGLPPGAALTIADAPEDFAAALVRHLSPACAHHG